MFELGIDLSKVQPQKVIPEGEYVARCTRASVEEVSFKSGASGKVVKASFQIAEGPFEGETVNDYIIFEHSASDVSGFVRHLADLLKAAGCKNMNSVEEVLGSEVGLRVAHDFYHGPDQPRPTVAQGSYKAKAQAKPGAIAAAAEPKDEVADVVASKGEAPDASKPDWMNA